ncbi:MAG: hypothetical protein KGL26_01090 [Pseudomonadota bacterium]|nr:hypothetical protein [Pseudomonadota bacterium]
MAEIDPLALTLEDRILIEELITEEMTRVGGSADAWRRMTRSAYRLERLYEKVRRLDVKAAT